MLAWIWRDFRVAALAAAIAPETAVRVRFMFTGLVRARARLYSQGRDRFSIRLPPAAAALQAELELGDSVAVDGVCLTVERLSPDGFVATASPETLERTNLGDRDPNVPVNIEPSLRAGSKLGGHFVSGHVDAVGQLVASERDARAWTMTFAARSPESWRTYLARYLVPKGSIAVNGISLTVADCPADGSWFSVAVIPTTYAETNLSALAIGSPVNLEADILSKYVERLLWERGTPVRQPALDLSFLQEHGYA